MNRLLDVACAARGTVAPCFVDISTGRRMPMSLRHNTLSYMSAEAMAAAFGGDGSYVPSMVGFIYGSAENPNFGQITRSQSWESLEEELNSLRSTAEADMQVVGFSYQPTLGGQDRAPVGDSGSSYDSGGDYNHILPGGSNAITFHAISNSQDPGVIAGSAFNSDSYIYQAVLLSPRDEGYYILARVSLEGTETYQKKPSGFEISLDWTVAFF